LLRTRSFAFAESAFAEPDTNTRVVVKDTHFNNKKVHVFMTFEGAKYKIFQAVGWSGAFKPS
jgi:hypothetical protein